MTHLAMSPKFWVATVASVAIANLALPEFRVEGNTVVLLALALTTAYNSISEGFSRRHRERMLDKQNATLRSIKITGEKTHTLSNSNMEGVLKTVVVFARQTAIALHRVADVSKADADIVAAATADTALVEAEKVLAAHIAQQKIVDAEDLYRKEREKENPPASSL
jgi:hypothetical protein